MTDALPAPSAPFDVAVVGAGPSGLAAALHLARSGFRTVSIAPKSPPEDQRTTALLGSSVGLLQHLGVWDALAARGAALRTMRLVDVTGRLVRAPEVAFHAREIERDSFGVNVMNRDITDVLSTAAAETPGLTRLEGTVETVTIGERLVRLETGAGAVVEARVAVAADGRRSRLREAAGIGIDTWTYPQSALVLNAATEAAHDEISTEFHGPNGPYVLVPLPGRMVSIVLIEKPEAAEALNALSDEDLGRELERRAHSLLGRMTVVGPRQVYPLSGLTAKAFGRNRVALVGETAHVFPPVGAQGLNLSLRDVGHLAEALVRARRSGQDIGGAETLAAYDRMRRPDVKSRTLGVDIADRALLSDLLPAQIARSLGLALADRIAPLRRLIMREGLAPSFLTPRVMRPERPRRAVEP
ncbi:UbiH/UbiF family hydroxylase [Prosthecomicrobium sp. N25]|uniref:UbiH/UbiF family hydroxylase n=1 Tax=Prosthecomicrobium sp. N25 TaxID=3129254 RepID=UPI0030779D29